MKSISCFLCFLFAAALAAQQPAQVTVQGDAKVGLIVTGTGNVINTTQIFGKSPEYAELKKRLDGLAAAIGKKAGECEQMRRDSLPVKYRDGCRAELIALNAGRDSVQKIETRFREDVIRLAETFSKIELKSERLRLAKQLFEEGKIREADNMLNAKEMKIEGEALLAEKTRTQEKLQKTDSLLRIKADEFALKARLKATDYGDSLRYDSAEMYFAQSLLYAENVSNLWGFASLLDRDNQTQRAIGYYERALQLTVSESEKALLANNLGNACKAIQQMSEAEKWYLKALEIREQLSKNDPAQFEADLARTVMNLSNFYCDIQKMEEAEKGYPRSLEIYERLAKGKPGYFDPDLARIYANMGRFYSIVGNMPEAEKRYLQALEIYEPLAKDDPVQFEPVLAIAMKNFGSFCRAIQKIQEAQQFLQRALDIYEHLVKNNPAQFEEGLANTKESLGNLYLSAGEMQQAEKSFQETLEIRERLAKSNLVRFELGLALSLINFGNFRQHNRQLEEAKKMYDRAFILQTQTISFGKTRDWKINMNYLYNNTAALRDAFELKRDYENALAIQEKRAACMYALRELDQQYRNNTVRDYGRLSWSRLLARKYPDAQAAAESALALDSSQNWVRVNLGHSHLLLGDWDKAKQAYEQYIAGEKDSAATKATLLKDWDDLEKAGVTHQDMAKARAWVRE